MNLPSGESLVRQIVHGQRYFEQHFGRRCTEVWIPDVFGYPAGLPQVFAAGGMTRFVTQKLSWNKQNRFPHHTFWWEGLDGTRVLTHFPPVDTYNAEITPAECAHAVANFSEHGWSDWSLMPFGHGDGGGGPTREMLERARRLADLDGAPRVAIGTPAEFFQHVEREIHLGAPVPVWRGELYFETHRGTLTSQIRTKLGNRRCEQLLREAELWAATSGVRGRARRALAGGAHAAVPRHPARVVDRVGPRRRRGDPRTRRAATAGTDRRQPRHAGTRHADAHQRRQPRPRRDRDRRRSRRRRADRRRMPAGSGPTQSLAAGGLAFRARVPGNGLAPAVPLAVDDHVVVTDRSMTNHHLAVRWDDAGNLTSIIDVGHAREILPDRAVGGGAAAGGRPSRRVRRVGSRGVDTRATPRRSRRPTGSRSWTAGRSSAP